MNDQVPRVITIPAGTGGATLRVLGDLITVTLRGEQTQRAFSLFFDQVPPGAGAPAHSQRGQETFIMFEGQLEFSTPDGTSLHTFTATRGTVVHVPEGAVHGYRNTSTGPAAFFVIFVPTGASERFFEQLGIPVSGPDQQPLFASPDPVVLQRLVEEFGIRIATPSQEG